MPGTSDRLEAPCAHRTGGERIPSSQRGHSAVWGTMSSNNRVVSRVPLSFRCLGTRPPNTQKKLLKARQMQPEHEKSQRHFA